MYTNADSVRLAQRSEIYIIFSSVGFTDVFPRIFIQRFQFSTYDANVDSESQVRSSDFPIFRGKFRQRPQMPEGF